MIDIDNSHEQLLQIVKTISQHNRDAWDHRDASNQTPHFLDEATEHWVKFFQIHRVSTEKVAELRRQLRFQRMSQIASPFYFSIHIISWFIYKRHLSQWAIFIRTTNIYIYICHLNIEAREMATPCYLFKKFPALKHLIAKERMSMWCYCMLHFIYYRPTSYLFIHLFILWTISIVLCYGKSKSESLIGWYPCWFF